MGGFLDVREYPAERRRPQTGHKTEYKAKQKSPKESFRVHPPFSGQPPKREGSTRAEAWADLALNPGPAMDSLHDPGQIVTSLSLNPHSKNREL